jgi:DNA-binding MarR family transcriptional regulator
VAKFESMTSDEIRAHRETVFLRLLLRVSQIETNELVEKLHARGHGPVQRAHIAVLGNIHTEGTRLVELARRLGVTRQAASQMVQQIEQRGFLERAPDPEDGRAVLVRHTGAGRALLLDALALMDEIETEFAEMVGVRTMARMKQGLRTIADSVDEATAL